MKRTRVFLLLAKAHNRFHAISVTPALEDAHPIATVTVSNEHETRTVTEKLE
jgi:hypothetical protein